MLGDLPCATASGKRHSAGRRVLMASDEVWVRLGFYLLAGGLSREPNRSYILDFQRLGGIAGDLANTFV